MNSKLYIEAIIALKFPNQMTLQAHFALLETVGDIYDFIKSHLTDASQEFYITTSPPLKKYTDMKATIQKENLAPSTLMYITFPNIDPRSDYPYIKVESFNQFNIDINFNGDS